MIVRRHRLALLAATSTLIAVGATGCAGPSTAKDKEFTGEQGRVANTVRALNDAYTDEMRDDNGARTVCRTLLSKQLVTELSRNGGCEKNARLALKDSDPRRLDVRKVDIAGDTATVQVRIKATNRTNDKQERFDTLTLVREGNTWKFAGTKAGQPREEQG